MADGDGLEVRTRQARKRAEHVERQRQVLEYRLQGWTFAEIALGIGRAESTVRVLYRNALKNHYRKEAEEELEITLVRCDRLIRRWLPDIDSKDPETASRATNHLLRTMSFQMELWGHTKRGPEVQVNVGAGPGQAPPGPEVWQHLEAWRRAAVEHGSSVIEATATALPPAATNGHDPT